MLKLRWEFNKLDAMNLAPSWVFKNCCLHSPNPSSGQWVDIFLSFIQCLPSICRPHAGGWEDGAISRRLLVWVILALRGCAHVISNMNVPLLNVIVFQKKFRTDFYYFVLASLSYLTLPPMTLEKIPNLCVPLAYLQKRDNDVPKSQSSMSAFVKS